MQLQTRGMKSQAKVILLVLEQGTLLCCMKTNCIYSEERIIRANIWMTFGNFHLKLFPGQMLAEMQLNLTNNGSQSKIQLRQYTEMWLQQGQPEDLGILQS